MAVMISGPVAIRSSLSPSISQQYVKVTHMRHVHTALHTAACAHKFQMMAICSATFHGDKCLHSNQESRHSGAQEHRQLLVSTGKCLLVNFVCFAYDANVSAACIQVFLQSWLNWTKKKQVSTVIYIFFWFFFLCVGIFSQFLHSHRLKPVFTVAYSIRHNHSPPQQREITAVVWMYALSSSSHSCSFTFDLFEYKMACLQQQFE